MPLVKLHYTILLIFILNTFSLFCFKTVLNITLLVRHPKTGKLVINFDPKVTEVIREAKCLLKTGLEVPKQALRLVKLESKINANHLRLQVNHNIFLHRWLGYLEISDLYTLFVFFRRFWQIMNPPVRAYLRTSPA